MRPLFAHDLSVRPDPSSLRFAWLRKFLKRLCRIILAIVGLVMGLLALLDYLVKPGEPPAPDATRLATDIHVSIADHPLTLPLIALPDDAFFPTKRADNLLRATGKDITPPEMPALTVRVETFGSHDDDGRYQAVCPLLTRNWAKSVCADHWSPITQALPRESFRLVDLTQLRLVGRDDARAGEAVPIACAVDHIPGNELTQGGSQRYLQSRLTPLGDLCPADIAGAPAGAIHYAGVTIDGNLGAIWLVAQPAGPDEEGYLVRITREGAAIRSFVLTALGPHEDIAQLREIMCRLTRPGAEKSPVGGVECADPD